MKLSVALLLDNPWAKEARRASEESSIGSTQNKKPLLGATGADRAESCTARQGRVWYHLVPYFPSKLKIQFEVGGKQMKHVVSSKPITQAGTPGGARSVPKNKPSQSLIKRVKATLRKYILTDYRNEALLPYEYTDENSRIVDCCNFLLDILKSQEGCHA